MCINMGKRRAVKVLQRAANNKNQNLKVDGGLGPMTLKAIRNVELERARAYRVKYYVNIIDKNLDLENTLFKYNKDFKSFYTRNCGMHIHLSRKAFNDMQMYKFILMMNSYKTLVHLVSQRRRISEYNSWCNFSDSIKDRVKSQASFNFKQQKYNKKF